MVRVKICGITNLMDAMSSVGAGCDAIGFVFYKKSPRYIAPEKARKIVRELPKQVIKVGVFVNSKEKEIKDIAKSCSLDILQFHGSESSEFCNKFKDYKIIKAFRVKNSVDLKEISKYKVFAYLFDTFVKSRAGGTGREFDWKLVRHLDSLKRPIFLSGGLTAKNVKQALNIVKPRWVDVSSSVEVSLGKKDNKKIIKFIKTAKT
jgi:phosphoribosylanthranilate isomerase